MVEYSISLVHAIVRSQTIILKGGLELESGDW